MKTTGWLLGTLLALSACGDSSLARQQYSEGAAIAREAGCDCDPFLSDAGSAVYQSANVSSQWADGYINACVDLRRECGGNR